VSARKAENPADDGPQSVDLDEFGGDETPTAACPACGAEVYEDADRCPACGQYITPGGGAGSMKRWWWIALVLAALALIVYAMAT